MLLQGHQELARFAAHIRTSIETLLNGKVARNGVPFRSADKKSRDIFRSTPIDCRTIFHSEGMLPRSPTEYIVSTLITFRVSFVARYLLVGLLA